MASISSVGQHGKITHGLLVVGFTNPDPNARPEDRDYSISFSCGGGTTAMCLWECMRSYMDVGPDAVPLSNDLENLRENLGNKGPFWGRGGVTTQASKTTLLPVNMERPYGCYLRFLPLVGRSS